jgi:hypothetical protein
MCLPSMICAGRLRQTGEAWCENGLWSRKLAADG